MVFWDTSALLKLYVAEPDSNALATLAQSEEPLAISAWTTHEILCGLHRKELLHDLKAGGAEAGIDTFANCDYRDHMIATLRETKAKLSRMVKLAANGEEVLITVHGKEMAKLVGLPARERRVDRKKWLKRLAQLRKKNWTGRYGKTGQQIQDEHRAARF
jgi:prevent-host-death family protein